MKRLVLAAGVALCLLGVVAPAARAADQGQVTPGAFCTPEGDTGHTSTGVPMVCSRTATDSRLRWRQAGTTATTSYQPGSCNGTVNLGSATVGQSLSGTLAPGCTFSGVLAMAVNGAGAGTKAPNPPPGGVNVSVQVTSTTSGLLDDPVAVALHCGGNTITATGTTAEGTPATATGTFTLNCTAATPTAARSTPSGVAFTGANIAGGTIGGAALIVGGLALVRVSRRRRAA